jgi:GAF domain-containing protein
VSNARASHDFSNPERAWAGLLRELEALLAGERDLVANAANTAALIFGAVPDLNWAGFYFLGGARHAGAGTERVLGPFQGRPACVRIAMGRGVCGTAAARRATVVVPDVEAFPGHIACDAASRSEIVVPLLRPVGSLLGVLDVDSPKPARFGPADQAGIEAMAALFLRSLRL